MKTYLMQVSEHGRDFLLKAVRQVVAHSVPADDVPFELMYLNDDAKKAADGLISVLEALPLGEKLDLHHLAFVDGAGDVNIAWKSRVVYCLFQKEDRWMVFDIVNGGHPAKRTTINDALNYALGRLETHVISTLEK